MLRPGFFAGIFIVLTGNQIAGILVAFTCMPGTVMLLKAADDAAEVQSKPRRVSGWLGGLGVALALVAIVVVL